MSNSLTGHILLILKHQEKAIESLAIPNCSIKVEYNLGAAISRAQIDRFDVIVLDADISGMSIEQIIQILREINPSAKIIVKTDENSKNLEAKIRKEKIYYYHLDSFGFPDLKLAITNALQKNNISIHVNRQNDLQNTDLKTILMVDENDEFIEIHKTNLRNHNYHVDISFDADEAYVKIKERPPHLLMVDMNIEVGSDGLHFMEKLMNDEKLIKIPVLLFESNIQSDEYKSIMKKIVSTLPAMASLKKPIKIEDVIPQVERLLHE